MQLLCVVTGEGFTASQSWFRVGSLQDRRSRYRRMHTLRQTQWYVGAPRLNTQIESGSEKARMGTFTHTHTQVIGQATKARTYALYSHLRMASKRCCVIGGMLPRSLFFPLSVTHFLYTFLPPWSTRRTVVHVWDTLCKKWYRETNTHCHLQREWERERDGWRRQTAKGGGEMGWRVCD